MPLDLTGKRFGRLTVTRFHGTIGKSRYWGCACDCGQTKRVQTSNLNAGHVVSCGCYRRAHRRGFRDPIVSIDAMFDRCTPEPNSGCWLWDGAVDENGYGRIAAPTYGEALAHRLSFKLAGGDVSDCVLHRCDTPTCCNPDHLFAGTQIDNINDMIRKGRHNTIAREKRAQ